MIPTVNVAMNNGDIFKGEKISELTEFIIDKFADEKLTYAEAKIVLDKTLKVLDEYSIIQRFNRK